MVGSGVRVGVKNSSMAQNGLIADMSTDPLFMKVGSEYYWYHNDHLKTPQIITTSSGAAVWSAKYTSFGRASIDSGSTVVNPLRFPGQYEDVETGLHYNYHRYYDPAFGRYLRNDPIGFAGGVNHYVYVQNNPVYLMDPWGLIDLLDLLNAERRPDYPGTFEGCSQYCKDNGQECDYFIPNFGEGGKALCKCKPKRCDPKIKNELLDGFSKETRDRLRSEARDTWEKLTGRRAIWDKKVIHHRIPLEWSHLMPGHPNRISNLAAVSPEIHAQINNAWTGFRTSLKGCTPTPDQVMKMALEIDKQFGHLMKFVK